ncbi:TPA: class IIb bacteriocin, lactobin A/cerein 7B family, partial [Streptococcus equi subsp. equi]|nr:class IIb bacteriocin, lactobin A/cerein 7B family [Streptococcus equi subsp. equi]HEK9547297.1 class IIb bacteriocin, lactobin A/cerein 7B family [Streptococcus equi subsp. equi]HEK9923219.1 class IIb bacteriocin, lactobin A/cerein 7B family [Streptococcus equi subsp. equi]
MKQYEDFQMLYELDLASVNGGKINWGSVAGHCAGGAIVTGAFSGPLYVLGAGIGC